MKTKTIIPQPIIDFVAEVKTCFSVETAFLFGSRARGNAHVNSDWDLYFVASKDAKVDTIKLRKTIEEGERNLYIHYHAGSKWALENMPGEWHDNVIKEGIRI